MSSRGDCFIHVRQPQEPEGLRFVFVTRCNCFPTVCIEVCHAHRSGIPHVCQCRILTRWCVVHCHQVLTQLAGLIEQYCGGLSEEIVRSNLTLVHELLGALLLSYRPSVFGRLQCMNCAVSASPTLRVGRAQN